MIREVHRGLLGQFGAGHAFLRADDQLLAGRAGVLDAHAQETALLAADVLEPDLVLELDGLEEVLASGVVDDDGFEVEEGLVLAAVVVAGQRMEVVGLGDVGVAGAFVLVEPVAEHVAGLAGLVLGDEACGLGHDGGVAAGLGGLGLLPVARVVERELGALCVGRRVREQGGDGDESCELARRRHAWVLFVAVRERV